MEQRDKVRCKRERKRERGREKEREGKREGERENALKFFACMLQQTRKSLHKHVSSHLVKIMRTEMYVK